MANKEARQVQVGWHLLGQLNLSAAATGLIGHGSFLSATYLSILGESDAPLMS
jgi:hypothetical protein